MKSLEPFHEERQMVGTVLTMLEALAARLNTGEPLPNAILGDAVDFLREFGDASCDAHDAGGHLGFSRSAAQHDTVQVPMDKMYWALEALDRGEAGAAGAFVISAREYVRAYRDDMPVDDPDLPKPAASILASAAHRPLPDQEQAVRNRAVLRLFNRLVERYSALTHGAKSSTVLGGHANER